VDEWQAKWPTNMGCFIMFEDSRVGVS
jgi:hypothetical protein